jgi:hypothetical protein
MGIDTRNTRRRNGFWQRLQPSFRFPLVRIFAPDCRVSITSGDVDKDCSSIRNEDLVYFCPVYSLDWSAEGQNHILASSASKIKSGVRRVRKEIVTFDGEQAEADI